MSTKVLQISPKVIVKEASASCCTFRIGPFESSFGHTIASALRRSCFFEEGYAISNVICSPKVDHEFGTIPGVAEDMQTIMLNLKAVRLKATKDEVAGSIVVTVHGKRLVTAGDIAAATPCFDVLNPDLVICNMQEEVKLQFELTVTKGRGYATAAEHAPQEQVFGSFPMDTVYTPVVNVKMHVDDNVLVDGKKDCEEVLLTIETDGTISPLEVLKNSANLLGNIFLMIGVQETEKERITIEEYEKVKADQKHLDTLLNVPLAQLGLPVRVVNNLMAIGCKNLRGVLGMTRSEFLGIPNIGKVSLRHLLDFLEANGLAFKSGDGPTAPTKSS